jgi:DNA-binding transcriptional ArsR family regulator
MVHYKDDGLDRVFAALADPTRRGMIARIAEDPDASASSIARPFDMSLPAAMKHLAILEKAGLVSRTKSGRTVHYRLSAERMRDVLQWLEHYAVFWSDRLDSLTQFLEDDACPTRTQGPASHSSGESARPRSASGRRGHKPKR